MGIINLILVIKKNIEFKKGDTMSPIAAFILGLIVGWVIEWIIDWIYWRRRLAEITRRLEAAEAQLPQMADLKKSDSARADLESQLATVKANYVTLQEKYTALEMEKAAVQMPVAASHIEEPVVPDDLIAINGIGPVIAKKLNDAGIFTFRQLGALTPEGLVGIVGDVIQRLADEENIIAQANKLAAEKDQAANS
jgi:predicted flap endonuclease-1-like 5' DNA nuclease